jgi:hypothetical protein
MTDPIEQRYRDKMNRLARALNEYFNGDVPNSQRTTGFVLLVFPFGSVPSRDRINYISNAERSDMITALKEIVARFEGRMMEPPTRPQ